MVNLNSSSDYILGDNNNEPARKRVRLSVHTPDPYIEITFDIIRSFNYNGVIICQINNCTSRKLHANSFSSYLATGFKYANPYQHRLTGPYPNLAAEICRAEPGTIEILHPPTGQGPSFACLYSQYKMGRSDSKYYINLPKTDSRYNYMAIYKDTYPHRLQYFQQCLNILLSCLLASPYYKTVVFPKYIGCGMAQGQWSDYEPIISKFCQKLKSHKPYMEIFLNRKL